MLNIYYISLVITFAVGLYTYKYLENNFKWLIPYLGFAVVYEFANIWDWLIWNNTNATCNNLEEIIEFSLFTCFMVSVLKIPAYKKNIYISAVVILLISFINMFFIQGIWKRNTISDVLQGMFLLTLVCIYYYNLLDKAEEDIVLLKHPPFLAATGLFFYITSKSLFYACFSYMAYKNNYNFYILAGIIPSMANILLNSLLIYAFVCSLKTKKLSL